MKEEIKKWMEQAREDYSTAKFNFEGKKYKSAAFWCQQCIEKAMKALLIKKTNNFPKIHDLTRLAKLNNAPIKIIELCAKINPAYIASRYPDSPKKYTEEECEQIIKYCEEVLAWTEKNLN